jgi:hypothetical protein
MLTHSFSDLVLNLFSQKCASVGQYSGDPGIDGLIRTGAIHCRYYGEKPGASLLTELNRTAAAGMLYTASTMEISLELRC